MRVLCYVRSARFNCRSDIDSISLISPRRFSLVVMKLNNGRTRN